MILIVGLGNPGEQYEHTPHNMGFRALDYFKARYLPSIEWMIEKTATYLTAQVEGKEVDLIKPLLYVNRSGFPIKQCMESRGILPESLWVAHDEFDLPWGEIKIDIGRSSAGHKGVQSIIESLGTQNFWRVRIGIKPAEDIEVPLDEYVTRKDSRGDEHILEKVAILLDDAIKNGIKKKRITI